MTTKDIIKILPFDMEFKTKLFNEYDNLDEDTESDLVDILWSGYCTYYKLKLDENIQKALSLDESDQQDKLDSTFYQRMVAKTEKEIEGNLNDSGITVDLSSTREALEKIIKNTSKN